MTYNKTKTRGKHVRPKDNPGSWVWYSDFKSLYTFEQKRLRPYQGPLSLMEDDKSTSSRAVGLSEELKSGLANTVLQGSVPASVVEVR